MRLEGNSVSETEIKGIQRREKAGKQITLTPTRQCRIWREPALAYKGVGDNLRVEKVEKQKASLPE